MIIFYVYTFLAGVLAANGVPHFVKGVTGERYYTPFGRPSSPVVNVAWGWANFVAAAILVHFAHPWPHIYRAVALFAFGGLTMGVTVSYLWANRSGQDAKAAR